MRGGEAGMTGSDLLTNDAESSTIETGLCIEGERVVLHYHDSFGRPRSKHLLCCTPTGVVEWKAGNCISCSIGTVETGKDGRYLKIPIRN